MHNFTTKLIDDDHGSYTKAHARLSCEAAHANIYRVTAANNRKDGLTDFGCGWESLSASSIRTSSFCGATLLMIVYRTDH